MTWPSAPGSKFHLPWDGYHILMNKIRDIAYRLSLNDNHAYITENDWRDKSIKACRVAGMD